jgi:hypothetical protein
MPDLRKILIDILNILSIFLISVDVIAIFFIRKFMAKSENIGKLSNLCCAIKIIYVELYLKK